MRRILARIINRFKRAANIHFIVKSVWVLLKTFLINIKNHYLKQIIISAPFVIIYILYALLRGEIDENINFGLTMLLTFLSMLAIYRYYWALDNSYYSSFGFKSKGIKQYYYFIKSSGDRFYTGLISTVITLFSLAIYIASFVLFLNLLVSLKYSPDNMIVWVMVIVYIPFSLAISRMYFGLISLPFSLYMQKQSFKEALLSSWGQYRHKYFFAVTIASFILLMIIFILILLLGQSQNWLSINVLKDSTYNIADIFQYVSYILIVNIYFIFAKSVYGTFISLNKPKK